MAAAWKTAVATTTASSPPPSPSPRGFGTVAEPLSPMQFSREELVRLVTDAACEEVTRDIARPYDALWQKGHEFFDELQRQQQIQYEHVAEMQEQLARQTDGVRRLQRDNLQLRQALEAMAQALRASPPLAVPQPQRCPVLPPPGLSDEAQCGAMLTPPQPPRAGPLASPDVASAITAALAAVAKQRRMQPSMAGSPLADQRPPSRAMPAAGTRLPSDAVSRLSSIDEMNGSIDMAGVEEKPNPSSPCSTPSTASGGALSFSLSLRRVDGMPLGIEVQPNTQRGFLEIKGVVAGSVVEAWNRQCEGCDDHRAILPGDHVISINGATEAEPMRSECVSKRVLRLTIVRPASSESPASSSEPGSPNPEEPPEDDEEGAAVPLGIPAAQLHLAKAAMAATLGGAPTWRRQVIRYC